MKMNALDSMKSTSFLGKENQEERLLKVKHSAST